MRLLLSVITFVLVITSGGQAWAGASAGAAAARRAAQDPAFVEDLRKESPEAADAFRDANEASDEKDLARALGLYEKVNELVPEFTPAMRRRAALLVENSTRSSSASRRVRHACRRSWPIASPRSPTGPRRSLEGSRTSFAAASSSMPT